MRFATCFFCAVLSLFSLATYGKAVAFDIKRLKTSLRASLSTRQQDGPFRRNLFARTANHGAVTVQHRALQQALRSDCYWNSDAKGCQVGLHALQGLLSDNDDPVVDYVHNMSACALAADEGECEDSGCLWNGDDLCVTSFDALRSFHDVECMTNASHIVDLNFGKFECITMTTKRQCRKAGMCFWTESENACLFDEWSYYYEIPTKDGLPKNFDELFEIRAEELRDGVQKAMADGDIITYGDIAEWNAPPLVCPKDYEEVMCNYVDGLTPYLLQSLTCDMYDFFGCFRDPSCAFDIVNGCVTSANVFSRLHAKAELAFAEGIEDADARAFELKEAECGSNTDENGCDREEDCTWLEDFSLCVISRKWEQEEVQRLLGNTSDPVCELFMLDVFSGCLDIEDESRCNAQLSCVYLESAKSCVASLAGGATYALALSEDTFDDLKEAEKACEAADTPRKCATIDV